MIPPKPLSEKASKCFLLKRKSLVFIKLISGTKDKPFEECFILLNSRTPFLKNHQFILLSYYEVAPPMLFTIGLLQILKILNNLGTSFLNIILVIFNRRKKAGKFFFVVLY
jgi:hypothetical protein